MNEERKIIVKCTSCEFVTDVYTLDDLHEWDNRGGRFPKCCMCGGSMKKLNKQYKVL